MTTEATRLDRDEPAPQRLVLVTGPSGAGRSTAINVLEDLGFEAIDNLPLSLIPRLLDGPTRPVPLALGLDVRNRDFSAAKLIELIDGLTRNPAYAPEVLYLDCATDTLVRRYSETRRRHPLASEGPPVDAIAAERDLLAPIRARADVLVDTSDLSPHDLRAELARAFGTSGQSGMTVSVQSFSYKRGVPRGLDMMFDCRFLANPHWVEALRGLDGRDGAVRAHVAADANFAPFFDKVRDLILFLLPAHLAEGTPIVTTIPLSFSNLEKIYEFETLLPAAKTGLERNAKISSHIIITIDKARVVGERIGFVNKNLMEKVEKALRLQLGL